MISIILIIVTLRFVLCLVEECPQMSVRRGVIHVVPPTNCSISNGVSIIVSNGSIASGRWYGLISYKCNECFGTIISKFEGCDDCLLCKHNEQIGKCKVHWLAIIIGFLSAIIFIFVLKFIISYIIYILIPRISEYKDKNKVKNIEKVDDKYPDVSQELSSVSYSTITKGHTPISIEDKLESDEDESDDLMRRMEEEYPADKAINFNFDTNQHEKGARTYPSLKSVLLSTLLLTTPSPARPCDQTFFISSSMDVCADRVCETKMNSLLHLTTASEICFTMEDGSTTKISLLSIQQLTYYQKIYYTSSYELMTQSDARCKGAGDCNTDGCIAGKATNYVENGLGEKLKTKFPGFGNASVKGSSCELTPLSCFGCFYVGTCVWYAWTLVPTGRLYSIYDVVGTSWRAKISILTKQGATIETISPINPFLDLHIPVHLISANYPLRHRSKKLIQTKDFDLKEINACELNQPIVNNVGDLQVGLDKNSYIYPSESVVCRAQSCDLQCLAPQPSIDRIDTAKYENITVSFIDNVPTIVDDHQGSIVLGISLNDIKHISTEKPRCAFSYEMDVSCTGCNAPPEVVFSVRDFASPGLVAFESNCTFSMDKLPCQKKPFKMTLQGNPTCCWITTKLSNDTIHFCLNYLFAGTLNSVGYIESHMNLNEETPSDKAWRFLQNTNFLTSLQISLGVTSIVLVTTRALAYYLSYRAGKSNVDPNA